MKKGKIFRYFSVLAIGLVFVALAFALLGQQTTGNYEKAESTVPVLDNSVYSLQMEAASAEKECLVLWNKNEDNSKVAQKDIAAIMDAMKISAEFVDISAEDVPDFHKFGEVIIAIESFSRLGGKIHEILDWVETGGNVMIYFPPVVEAVFQSAAGRLGIQAVGWNMYELPGISIVTDFMAGGQGNSYMIEETYETSLSVSLSEDNVVHVVSADENRLPVIWERKYGEGTVVFDNFGIMDKAYRGIHAAAFSLLGDICVWPVINGSAFYIDDFPSPVPSGSSEYIKRDYGIEVKNFYSNIWWPDIAELGEKYGIKYSGMVVEDYGDELSAPFERNRNTQRFKFFGTELLKRGGELGIHGYNHIPLCREGFDADFGDDYKPGTYEKGFDYGYWETKEDMEASIREVLDFTTELFPKEQPGVYVPPSNILSIEARKMLAEKFPEIKAVASIYFKGDVEYTQNFEVAEDGIIETPRIISGCVIDSFMEIAALSELNLHYVNSHFQHPDDVLDPDRGADKGWEAMKNRLGEYMEWLYTSVPEIRNLTASEMAGAVQRYYYLKIDKKITGNKIVLTLNGFQDEAQIFIRINGRKPDSLENCITGGTMTHISGNLYLIQAQDSLVTIERGEI